MGYYWRRYNSLSAHMSRPATDSSTSSAIQTLSTAHPFRYTLVSWQRAQTYTSGKTKIQTIVRRDYKCNKRPCNGHNAHRETHRSCTPIVLYHGGYSRHGAFTASSGQVLATFRRWQQQHDRYGHGVV